MLFRIQKAVLSDIGTDRRVNQDALLCKIVRHRQYGRICFAVVCDGLGGLSQGEIASAAFVRRAEDWFFHDFVCLLKQSEREHLSPSRCLHRAGIDWQSVIMEMNDRISRYGQKEGFRLGTTAVLFLLIGCHYLIMHVGDTRCYIADERGLKLVTHDHSLVQKQLDAGILTPAQAALSDKKSVLLQCIGASDVIRPDSFEGLLLQDTSVLLCTDGFWRRLPDTTLQDALRADPAASEASMSGTLKQLTSAVKQQGEHDNISAVFLMLLTERSETDSAPVVFPKDLVAVC